MTTTTKSASVMDKINDPALLAAVLGGGGIAGLASLSANRKLKRRGETPEQRRKRILLNTLGLGAAGAAVGGLGMAGLRSIGGALPAGDKDPITGTVTGTGARALYGAGGIAGMQWGAGNRRQSDAHALIRHLVNNNTPGKQTLGVLNAGLKDNPLQTIKDLISDKKLSRGSGLSGASGKINGDMLSAIKSLGIQTPEVEKAIRGASGMDRLRLQTTDLLERKVKAPFFGSGMEAASGGKIMSKFPMSPVMRTAIGAGAVFAPEVLGTAGKAVFGGDE